MHGRVSVGRTSPRHPLTGSCLFRIRRVRCIGQPDQAEGLIVAGFVEPLVKELPMEYAIEMNRLLQLQMEGSDRGRARWVT